MAEGYEFAQSTSISAEPYQIETDVTSNCPLHYLSVLSKYFLSVDLVSDTNVQKIIECGVFEGYSKGKVGRDTKTTAIVTGSSAEGLSIPDYLDTSTNSWHVSSDSDKVTVISNELDIDKDLPDDKQDQLVKYQTDDVLNGRIDRTNIKYTKDYLTTRRSDDQMCQDKCLSKCDILTECSSGINTKSSNEAVALEFKSWPRLAIPWMVRSRQSGWPSPEVKVAVVQGGYHVIPVDMREEENGEGLLWEYAFYKAERNLAHSLSRGQRQVFVLFDIINLYYFETPDMLAHEHLRTVFFWMLEKIPAFQFHENNIGKMLLQLLNELALALASRKLEHYFIPGVNLFEAISSDHCNTLWKKVKWVSNNAIHVIVNLNQKLQFSGIGFRIDLETCFSDHSVALKENPKDEIAFYNALIAGCLKMIEHHLCHLDKMYKGKLNHEQKAQTNLLTNICMQALWDINCYSAETDDFPSDLHSCIYTLGYYNDKAKVIGRVVLHICNKAGVAKDRAVDCVDDIVHYCKVKQNLQRAANLSEVRKMVLETEGLQDCETDNSKLYLKQTIKQS